MAHQNDLNEVIVNNFGNKLRVRVAGVLVHNNKLLLVKHIGLGQPFFWSPPGGGCEFGESLSDCLKREFKEETRLDIDVGKLLLINEFIQFPLHALEFFFQVHHQAGDVQVGHDPELGHDSQIIQEVKFLSFEEVNSIEKLNLHSILHGLNGFSELFAKNSIIFNASKPE